MDCMHLRAYSTVILGIAVGCGRLSQEEPAKSLHAGQSDKQQASPVAGGANTENTAIAAAARGFLDAVIQGDTEQATTFLTPQAAERLQQGGQAFQPPGLDTWTCRIGEVRRMNDTQAFVQCYWSDPSVTGETADEMCCLVKHVGSRWRVSGIAFQVNPDEMPRILDFERPAQSGPASPQTASQPERGISSYYDSASSATPRSTRRPDEIPNR